MSEFSYTNSTELFERAHNRIPLASQTFSKSFYQYPVGSSPLFLEKGNGARVWDVDGNEYIDFVNGLLCVLLGYQDPDVDKQVRAQMLNGVSFSLPHPLEIQVSEALCEMVPNADMVRFGKNGSDVTAGAVRLARAVTGREYIAVCGYHGWQDWYIGTTPRDKGVPKSTKALTLTFKYNDIQSLKDLFDQYRNKIAAVIMEPMNIEYPKDGFLENVRELASENNSLLIFDEIITGFRFHRGGAQTLFNVRPDLMTFGKGLANGYPLSALCGSRQYMECIEDIFFSFTFGGETISLAAAHAVLDKLKNYPVLELIHAHGNILLESLPELICKHNLGSIIGVSGHPSWTFLHVKSHQKVSSSQIRSYINQEMFKNGILFNGTHNLSFAHTREDIDYLLTTYDKIFLELANHLNQNTLHSAIFASEIKDVFKVRDTG